MAIHMLRMAGLLLLLAGLSGMMPGAHAAGPDAAPRAVAATRPRHLTIIAFGSSSTQGIGASSPAASYPARLQAELDASAPPGEAVEVRNRGIGGEDVDDMMARLPAIIGERPDIVIWQTGSNDPLRGVTLAHFIAATRAGIRQMQAAGIRVMLMEPQFCRVLGTADGQGRFRTALRGLGSELGVPVIRRYALMQQWLAEKRLTESQLISPDGLHMTDAGYALLAHAVAGMLLGG